MKLRILIQTTSFPSVYYGKQTCAKTCRRHFRW